MAAFALAVWLLDARIISCAAPHACAMSSHCMLSSTQPLRSPAAWRAIMRQASPTAALTVIPAPARIHAAGATRKVATRSAPTTGGDCTHARAVVPPPRTSPGVRHNKVA